jgi:uncharacterized membrane protein YdjX (TVP38/TMEM64 family)
MSKKAKQRLVILGGIIIIVLLFIVFDLEQYLTLSYLKSSKESFGALYGDHPVLVVGSYILIYIVVTGISLPGAAILTLAGGALFGFVVGTIAVSFASTIGATLACFFSRFVLRDWVQGKFGDKLSTINRGIEQEGPFYLFTLRLIPVFPFFVINLVVGLTHMRLATYYWVSQIGMLPGTMVYVNAGKELGKLESLSGILSPSLLISFVILGLFPIAVKKVLGWYRKRQGAKLVISAEEPSSR